MKKIIGLILTLVCLQVSAQYDSTRVWQSVNGDGFIWKNGQFNGALIFPTDTPHLKTAQRAIGFKGATPYYWTGSKWNSFGGAGGTGTLTDFVIGNMTPFFTTNAATTTTVPTITFTLSPSAAYTIWGNNGGSAAAPAYFTPVLASNLFSNQGTTTTVLHGNASGPPSWGQVSAADLNLTGTQSVRITGSAIALHNDQTTPDTFQVYGTDSTAARGWQPSQPSRLTSPQDGDNIVIQNDATGRSFYVNVAGSQVTAFTGTPTVVDLGNLNYFVNTNGPYKINGIWYPSASGIVTLPIGTAVPGEGRTDLIGATAAGVGSAQGDNSPTPQEPVPADFLTITSVRIDEDQSVPATASSDVLIWNENVGPTAEATYGTTGAVTANPNANTAGQAFNGTKYITVTAMANNARINFTFGSAKDKTNYTYLVGRIKLNNAWAATTTYSARLFNGATLSNAVSLLNWGIVRTTTGSYMTFAIPMSQFTGSTQFTGVTIQRTTVAGTTNWQLDYLQLQTSAVVTPPPSTSSSVKLFTTVAGMRAFTVNSEVSGSTLGYYTANDGGGADYYWDGTSTATDDGFLVIKSVNTTGRWRLIIRDKVNVRWAGAKGDDATDDRANILKARNEALVSSSHGVLYFPPGIYRMSDSLKITGQMAIQGAVAGFYVNNGVQLHFDNDKKGLYVLSPANNIQIENIYLKGGGTDTLATGFWTNTVCNLTNVTSAFFPGNGFELNTSASGNADLGHYTDIYAIQNIGNGIYITGGESSFNTFNNVWANTNGRSNVRDEGYLGNRWNDVHTSYAGMLSGQKSWVTHGGNYFVFIGRNQASGIEPEVTSGWRSYWQPLAGADVPGVVSAWSGATKYVMASAFAITSDNSKSGVIDLYTEQGQAGIILGGYSTLLGGVWGSGFAQVGLQTALAARTGGYWESYGNIRSSDPNDAAYYSALTGETGLITGHDSKGYSQWKFLSDTTAHFMNNNSPIYSGLNIMGPGKSANIAGRAGNFGDAAVPFLPATGIYFFDEANTYGLARNFRFVATLPLSTTGFANGDLIYVSDNSSDGFYKNVSGTWTALTGGGGGGGSDSPDRINGTATGTAIANMNGSGMRFTNIGDYSIATSGTYSGGLFGIGSDGRIIIGDVDDGGNSNRLDINDNANEIKVNLGATGVFKTNSLADTSNYVDQSYTSVAWASDHINNAVSSKADKNVSINTQTASYTLVLGDAGKAVELNNASANNLTVPTNASVAFPVGTQIIITQYGAGQTTIVASGGVTIRSAGAKLKLNVQYSGATLYKRDTNEWVLFGDITN